MALVNEEYVTRYAAYGDAATHAEQARDQIYVNAIFRWIVMVRHTPTHTAHNSNNTKHSERAHTGTVCHQALAPYRCDHVSCLWLSPVLVISPSPCASHVVALPPPMCGSLRCATWLHHHHIRAVICVVYHHRMVTCINAATCITQGETEQAGSITHMCGLVCRLLGFQAEALHR